jgi:hypothetical protein
VQGIGDNLLQRPFHEDGGSVRLQDHPPASRNRDTWPDRACGIILIHVDLAGARGRPSRVPWSTRDRERLDRGRGDGATASSASTYTRLVDSVVFDLGLLAPVPRDHLVLVATMQREESRGTFVLDQTAGVLYADPTLWGPLGRRVTAVTDPLATLAQYGWRPVKKVVGRVVGAMISTTSEGEANHAETRLFLDPEPPTSPYR